MNRRSFLKYAACTGAGAVMSSGWISPKRVSDAEGTTEPTKKPNIILIMADDMGFSDIGCYGGEVRTPHIDALAAGGLRFTQFYNASRCCPTRASLITGLYQHQAGVGHMTGDLGKPAYQGYLNDRCVTIAEALKTAGYTTLMSGKWHLGARQGQWPADRGFDDSFVLLPGGSNYWKPGPMARGHKRWNLKADETFKGKEFYMTDAFSDYAVKFIDQHGRAKKPFFLYLSYTAPHFPMHAREEDMARYKGKYDAGWDKLRIARYERMVKMGIIDKSWPLTPRNEKVTAWKDLDAKRKEDLLLRMEIYAAMIDRMDYGIGRVIDKLRKTGALDNTLVLFLSDNGGNWEGGPWGWDWGKGKPGRASNFWCTYGQSWGNLSNTPFRLYKHWVHEGGIATPLIAHWPTVVKQKGKLTDQTGHIIDIMATCCDVAGAKYPAEFECKKITPLEGKSLLPILKGEKRAGHKALFWEHTGNKAVRAGKWKLVSRDGGVWELYDLEKDRTELTDLAAKNPAKVQELKAAYDAWAKRCGVLPWPVKKKKKRK